MDLIADIGATNARCALLDDKGHVLASERFANSEFDDPVALLTGYLERRRHSDVLHQAAIAVAAPVLGDEIRMINIDWSFSQRALAKRLQVPRLLVVNDFEAIARGLPDFSSDDLVQIGSGRGAVPATQAVLGPGSGLGVASLVPSPEGWAIASGEGGHVTMAAASDEEAEILALIRGDFGHCSAERVLSGPGLVNLYRAVARLTGETIEDVAPERVNELAAEGDPTAVKAREHFFAMLGTVAGNLALTVGARGGVYVAGGIIPLCLDAFQTSAFRERFESKGRYRSYMERIPTYAITNPVPAFVGLRRLLGYR